MSGSCTSYSPYLLEAALKRGLLPASKEVMMCCSVPRVSIIEDTLRDAKSAKGAQERQAVVPDGDREARMIPPPSGKEKVAPLESEAVSCDC